MGLRKTAAAAFFIVAALFALQAAAQKNPPAKIQKKSPAEIQKARTALMKSINRGMRKSLVFIKKGDFQNLAPTAKEVSALLARIPKMSPKGSAFGKTRIKPKVWDNFDHYRKLSAEAAAAATRLAEVAGAGDKKSAMQAFRGLVKGCRECHKPYRKKKRPKE